MRTAVPEKLLKIVEDTFRVLGWGACSLAIPVQASRASEFPTISDSWFGLETAEFALGTKRRARSFRPTGRQLSTAP